MATPTDAELILKLYELRTEPTMREARKFVATFNPSGPDEIVAMQKDFGGQNNSYWRQVLSYWEMAASLVLRGALDPDLFLDCNGEPFFLYAKYTPYHEVYAQVTGVPFMRHTAKLIETYPAMQDRYTMMLARMNAMKKQAAPETKNA